MYFPYLRGKTFELLALRECADLANINLYISPIIEPVLQNTASLKKLCDKLIEKNINFNIIVNPKVGAFAKDENSIENIIRFVKENLLLNNNFQVAYLINSTDDLKNLQFVLERTENLNIFFTLIHNCLNDDDLLQKVNEDERIKFNIVDFSKTSARYYRKFKKGTLITLSDGFKVQKNNSLYADNIDEFFSEEYRYYKEEGYFGFSDYLTIGDIYNEGGFLPYAVVIHITYEFNNQIRIFHAVSDSNEDATDTAGKFYEALEKLITWVNKNNITKTKAILNFEELYNKQKFPGLGTIKKLSMLNHLELIYRVLGNEYM